MKKLLVVALGSLLLSACEKSNDSTKKSSQLDESIDQIKKLDPEKGAEIEKSVGKLAEATGRDNLCELLTPQLVRSAFELSEDVKLENKDSDIICSYTWEQDGRTFDASLNFSSAKPMSASAAKAQWDKLAAMPMMVDKDLGPVAGVGEQAIWSDVAGGQLRVLAKGNVFYVSVKQIDAAWLMASMNVNMPGIKKMTKEEAESEKAKARDASKARAVKIAQTVVTKL